jgi:hypothetical protein
MRHSLEVAQGSYRKINAIPSSLLQKPPSIEYPTIEPPPPPMMIPILAPVPRVNIPVIRREPPKYFDLKTWGKEYRTTHKVDLALKRKAKYEEDKFNILKNKQLWYLRHGVVKRPTQASQTKYKLFQDDETGYWYSNA